MSRTTAADRAVSPVIGIILIVAITVVLAAVVGGFALNLGTDVSKSVDAGASVTFTTATDDGEVRVTYVDRGNSERLEVQYGVETNPGANSVSFASGSVLDEPGQSAVLEEAAGNPDETIEVKVTVVGFLDTGEKGVVLEKTGQI